MNADKPRCVMLGEYMLSHESTVRACAQAFGISKSTVHKDVSERLKGFSPALYKRVRQLLDKNKEERHIRGGIATKQKYAGAGK
ncbi:MAG: sporulation transcriptional regulator SpoIIID [Ruminococcus sp.]|nr:sporulation transcriptional regulator SpoIIID [Ruminococcus sp.]MBQ7070082.1 sporulation transcriptional regulator SpoIIID [Ruminococcus sp.]